MTARRVLRLTSATALAASMIGLGVGTASAATAATSVRPATTFLCSASGSGSNLGAAEHDAEETLKGDYTVLSGFTLASSTQHADGSWFVVMTAHCGNPR